MSIKYLQNCKHGHEIIKKECSELGKIIEKENLEELIRTSIRPTIQSTEMNSIGLRDKLQEELLELLNANSKENFIEEWFDVVQVLVNYADYLKVSSDDLKAGIKIHNEKLLDRGWKFKNF